MTIGELLEQVKKRNIPLDTVIKTNDTEIFDDEPYFTWIPEARELVIGPYECSKIEYRRPLELGLMESRYYATVDILGPSE